MSVKCPISQLPIENDPKLSILHAYHSVITTAQLSLTILSQVQKTIECVYKGRSPVMYAGNLRRRTRVRNIRESDEVGSPRRLPTLLCHLRVQQHLHHHHSIVKWSPTPMTEFHNPFLSASLKTRGVRERDGERL